MFAASDAGLLWRIFRNGWTYRWMILLFLGATAATGGLMALLFKQLGPFLALLGSVADQGMQGVDAGAAGQLAAGFQDLGLELMLLAPLAAGAAFVSWWSGQWVANRSMRHLRTRLVGHLVALDLGFHTGLNRGDLLTRLTTDLTSTLRVQQYLYGKLLQRPLESAGLIGVLFWLSPAIGATVLAVLLPVIVVLVPLVRRTRRHAKQARATLAANIGVMEQITAGIRVVKSFGSAEREQARYAEANRVLEADNMRLARTRAQSDAVTAGAVFLIAGGGIVCAGLVVAHLGIAAGPLVVAIGALARLITAVREVIRTWGDLQEQLPSAERVYALLDRPSAVADAPDAAPCPVLRTGITLTGVRFAYAADADEVLRGVDLTIAAGRTTALVGASGSGKSTILDLIPRLHDATAGTVAWDGVDVRRLAQANIIAQVAIVGQDAYLFDDTIAANIAYGRPGATAAEVEAAARRAHVHDDILRLEGGRGYATAVGDRGARLSGGQRQRIAIARAFLRDAPVLLLDEPTSALDAASERHVQDALADLMRGRTVVIVAHRLATVQHADAIHVLAGKGDTTPGVVVESGTHAALVARGGVYARLVALQQLG
jgi:ATP-binding cassette, subfamily B, bacterial MsbA